MSINIVAILKTNNYDNTITIFREKKTVDAYNKQLDLYIVAKRSELLNAYTEFIFDDCTDGDKEAISEFIKQLGD